MNYTEQAIAFACQQERLAGILVVPEATVSTGVIVIVGGPQYRVGSHRQFVLLSRALSAEGYSVLRFDYRGMGDSTGTQRDFLQVTADIAAAIDALQQFVPSVKRVVLWGLCDGAAAALLYFHETEDPRVRGMCLLNPWARSEASLARAHIKHYYVQRIRQRDFWAKLLSGKVARVALASLWKNVRLMSQSKDIFVTPQLPFQHRMALAWKTFNGNILLLLSGNDYTAKEFLEYARMDRKWAGLLEAGNVARHDLPDADHTTSAGNSRALAEALTLAWLKSHVANDT